MFPMAYLGGPWDIAIVALVVVLLFGGSKLAGLGKSMGEGIKEFKKATQDENDPPITSAGTATPTNSPTVAAKTEEK